MHARKVSTMLRSMNPFCARHLAGGPMPFLEFGAEGNVQATAWLCPVEGCKRSYSRGHGYQNIGENVDPELNFQACPKCRDGSLYVSGQKAKNTPFLTCDACGSLIIPEP